jgi:HK97 family phage major capsid protein
MHILKDILAKEVADLSTEEKAFVTSNWKDLSDADKTKFADAAPTADEDVDDEKVKSLVTKAIADQVKAQDIDTKIAAAATEVAKSLGEQRSKAIHATVVPTQDEQAKFKAFFKAVVSGDSTALKAMNTGNNAAAGYTIPRDLSLEIIKNASNIYGAARRLFSVQVVSGPGNTTDILKEGDGLEAYWTEEGAAKSSSQLSFGLVTITLKKLATIVPFTDEMLEDTAFDLIGYVKEQANKAFFKQEDTAYLMGTGTPYMGVMNDPNVNILRIAGTNPKAFTVDDLQDLTDTLPSTFMPGAKFAMNRKARSVIRKMKDGNGHFIFSPATAGNPATVLGFDVEEIDILPDLSVSGSDKPILAFGNFAVAGLIRIKNQLQVKQLTEATITDVDGETQLNLAQQDMTALRFVQREGFLLRQPKAVSVLKTT